MRHDSLTDFMGRFAFAPEKAWRIGVERECFIVDAREGKPIPRAPEVLAAAWHHYPELRTSFGYELSACQLEMRTTDPVLLCDVAKKLREQQACLESMLEEFGYRAQYTGVGPVDMVTDVYPDGRYARITRHLSPQRLLAACRIIGTHIQVGMPDADTALRVYNGVVRNLHGLRIVADKTCGERMRIYAEVQPRREPIPFCDWHAMHLHAIKHGWSEDTRQNWMLVRITRFGTIEFRLFDGTDSPDEVASWARECRALCLGYA